jgi:hypothetical protein
MVSLSLECEGVLKATAEKAFSPEKGNTEAPGYSH